jgi:hypothetical protein
MKKLVKPFILILTTCSCLTQKKCFENPKFIYSIRANNAGNISYDHILTLGCENTAKVDSTFLSNFIKRYKDTCKMDVPIGMVEIISDDKGIDFISNSPDHIEIRNRTIMRVIFNLENYTIIDSIYFNRNIPH